MHTRIVTTLLLLATLLSACAGKQESASACLSQEDLIRQQQACTAMSPCSISPSSTFSPATALSAAGFAQLAYLPRAAVNATLQEQHFELLGYYDLQPADYQFYIAKGIVSDRPHYVISIRGSDSSEDWITNLQLENRAFKGMKNACVTGLVHKGFLGYAEAVYNAIAWNDATRPMLFEITHGKADVLITGHSLGGGVALLYAAMLKAIGTPDANMHTYTFGAPAVGDEIFSNSQATASIFRVEIQGDPIPAATLISPWLYGNVKRNLDDGETVNKNYKSDFMHVGKSYTFVINHTGYTENKANYGLESQTFTAEIANNILALFSSKYNVVAHNMATYINILEQHRNAKDQEQQQNCTSYADME